MLKHIISLSFLICLYLPTLGQNTKPKVALVLSGGGAKGVAHIPTLQALDSLGIVPDLIVGNSMGSIVGGLYAMGYSGNEIAEMTKNADWSNLMGGNLSLNDVSNEEKSEFNQYLVNASIIGKKLKVNPFIINDHNLKTFINSITHPVYNISDFDSLAIPFRAIATDIVEGKEVVLNKGSLAFAMRASMSIPAVFSAVPYKNTLLIDGGVLNNFPVDVAKNLGADFIIGSDVGNGMLPKERLDNLQSLLLQSGMIASNLKNSNNRDLCDILLSHGPNISFSTSDFAQSKTIYEQGKIALKNQLPKLIKISEELKKFKQREHKLPKAPDTILLNRITYKGISKANLDFIKARSNLKTHHKYTEKEIASGINKSMGSALFSDIKYGLVKKNNKTELFFNASEIANHQIKGAIHYDNELGAGLILNYTGRNLIGTSSRSLITVDVTKNPKIRIQHQNIFGEKKKMWMRTEVFANRYRQGLFYSGFKIDDVKYRFFHASTQLNQNLSPLKSYVGVGLEYENSAIKPTIPTDLLSDESKNKLKKFNYQTLLATIKFNYNTLNNQYFATKGSLITIMYKRAFINNLIFNATGEENINFKGGVTNHHKFIFEMNKRISIAPKITAITGVTGAFIFEDPSKKKEFSYINSEIGVKYFIGGNTVLTRSGSFLMPGLKEGEIIASQFIKSDIAFQYELHKKFFLTPHMDVVVFGVNSFSDYTKNIIKSTSDWDNVQETAFVFSTGLRASYNSILGPINIDTSFANGINKFRFFIGVGYSFVGL